MDRRSVIMGKKCKQNMDVVRAPAMVETALSTLMAQLDIGAFEFLYCGELWQIEIKPDDSLLLSKLAISAEKH
jgi:hypothetical protein